ncbi:MAG TPA: hypothetical protein PKV80_24995 [Leptospiraceae bacterium]|nr:hypothetical protein [Leptospiraceae bacterium]
MDIEKLKIEAAKNTWAGKQTLKYNFTEVNVKAYFNDETNLYENVIVQFNKKDGAKK